MMRLPFKLNGAEVAAGARQTVNIPLSRLADHTRMNLVAHVIHGRRDGPVMFVSAAIHGDEIIGVEIIRRLAALKTISRLRGTLILVPVVNTYGFIAQSRYLPDRRDLNRSFPGGPNGSLAAQLAHTFMTQVVDRCQYGVDLHSGAVHRVNLPQIRADLDHPEVEAMARAFGASMVLDSHLRDGSLREAAQERGCNILLYEAGEALRFDEVGVRIGVKGVVNVMRHVGMLASSKTSKKSIEPVLSRSSHWLRAPIGGLMRAYKGLGDRVKKDEVIAAISGPLGDKEELVLAKAAGIVIGRTNLPVVNRGDALFHVARVRSSIDAEEAVGALEEDLEKDPLFDDMAII